MKSKIRISNIQAEAKSTERIQDLSKEESNRVIGGYQSLRQATPTRQKFSILALKLIAENSNLNLFATNQ